MSMSHLSRVVWKVSLPIVLAAASETLLHVIDTLLLARVGVAELGAIAIADSVLLLSLVIPLSFVEALQILASRHAGQRRPAAAGAVFNAGFLTVFVISVVTSVALKFLWPLLGNWFVGPGGVGTAIGDYLQIAAYGIFLVAASFAYSALLVASGKTRALIPATILLAATSIPLSYALIFGKFGFPRMGMRGAALGSLAAEAVTFLFLTICVVRTFDSARYRLFRFHIADWRSLRLLTRLSASIAAQRSLEVICWFVFFLILERVSLEALAIANTVYTCHLVFWIPTEGFAETSYSLVSRFIGRNGTHRKSAARGHRWRPSCHRPVSLAGPVRSPMVLWCVRFGMGASRQRRREPARGCFGNAGRHSR